MASTYSTSLLLELIGNGDQSGTWGTTTNKNLGTLLEQAIVGQVTISMNNANYTLSNYNGTSDEARNAVIIISGNQNASYVVNCPAVQKLYVITNSLNASATAYFGPTGGSTLSIPNGQTVFAYCTGSAMVQVNLSVATSIANTGGWNVTPSGTKLYFNYNGTNVASLDSSGNFISLLTVAAGTTP
jgi:hypothetical protein